MVSFFFCLLASFLAFFKFSLCFLLRLLDVPTKIYCIVSILTEKNRIWKYHHWLKLLDKIHIWNNFCSRVLSFHNLRRSYLMVIIICKQYRSRYIRCLPLKGLFTSSPSSFLLLRTDSFFSRIKFLNMWSYM